MIQKEIFELNHHLVQEESRLNLSLVRTCPMQDEVLFFFLRWKLEFRSEYEDLDQESHVGPVDKRCLSYCPPNHHKNKIGRRFLFWDLV